MSPWHFGINEGPMVVMIENYKTGLVWQLMREPAYPCGQRLGFKVIRQRSQVMPVRVAA